ncbi:hypothetical protein M2244_002981 [Rhodoferax antarcticus]|nr:hypothetical protein [Rhodoferax antarcticus]
MDSPIWAVSQIELYCKKGVPQQQLGTVIGLGDRASG